MDDCDPAGRNGVHVGSLLNQGLRCIELSEEARQMQRREPVTAIRLYQIMVVRQQAAQASDLSQRGCFKYIEIDHCLVQKGNDLQFVFVARLH